MYSIYLAYLLKSHLFFGPVMQCHHNVIYSTVTISLNQCHYLNTGRKTGEQLNV